MEKKRVVKKSPTAGSKTKGNMKAAGKPRRPAQGGQPVKKKVRRKTGATPQAPSAAPKAPMDWKKILRPIFYIVFITGCIWFYMNYKKKADARKDYNKAVKMLNTSEKEKAVALLEDIKSRSIDDPVMMSELNVSLAREYASAGRELMVKRKWDEAIKIFLQAIELSPEMAVGQQVYYKLGSCYHSSGQKEKAIEYMKIALEKNPDNRLARKRLEVFEQKLKAE